jgi:cysteine-S-conjugate beta-lyase
MSIEPLVTPSIETLRHRHSSKWRRYEGDVLPMHVAEMDFEIAPEIRQLLIEMTTNSDLGYLGPVPELGLAFASFASKRWNFEVDPKQLKLATDVGVAAVELFRALGKEGDKVVINSPVYTNFFSWIKEAKMVLSDVPLNQEGESWNLDLLALETSFKEGAKFYLMCNPHNPLGKLYTKEELIQVALLAKKYDVVVISDEIHAPLTYRDAKFVPFLSVSEEASEVGIMITSSSKAWNTAGLKAAFLLTNNKSWAAKLMKLPPDMHWRSSLLGAFAMAESYTNGINWINSAVETIESNQRFLKAELEEKLPQVKMNIADAGYLAWLDVSAFNLGSNPTNVILEKARVGVVPGTDLGEQYTGFVRFNFATSEENIREAIDRIKAIL